MSPLASSYDTSSEPVIAISSLISLVGLAFSLVITLIVCSFCRKKAYFDQRTTSQRSLLGNTNIEIWDAHSNLSWGDSSTLNSSPDVKSTSLQKSFSMDSVHSISSIRDALEAIDFETSLEDDQPLPNLSTFSTSFPPSLLSNQRDSLSSSVKNSHSSSSATSPQFNTNNINNINKANDKTVPLAKSNSFGPASSSLEEVDDDDEILEETEEEERLRHLKNRQSTVLLIVTPPTPATCLPVDPRVEALYSRVIKKPKVFSTVVESTPSLPVRAYRQLSSYLSGELLDQLNRSSIDYRAAFPIPPNPFLDQLDDTVDDDSTESVKLVLEDDLEKARLRLIHAARTSYANDRDSGGQDDEDDDDFDVAAYRASRQETSLAPPHITKEAVRSLSPDSLPASFKRSANSSRTSSPSTSKLEEEFQVEAASDTDDDERSSAEKELSCGTRNRADVSISENFVTDVNSSGAESEDEDEDASPRSRGSLPSRLPPSPLKLTEFRVERNSSGSEFEDDREQVESNDDASPSPLKNQLRPGHPSDELASHLTVLSTESDV